MTLKSLKIAAILTLLRVTQYYRHIWNLKIGIYNIGTDGRHSTLLV